MMALRKQPASKGNARPQTSGRCGRLFLTDGLAVRSHRTPFQVGIVFDEDRPLIPDRIQQSDQLGFVKVDIEHSIGVLNVRWERRTESESRERSSLADPTLHIDCRSIREGRESR